MSHEKAIRVIMDYRKDMFETEVRELVDNGYSVDLSNHPGFCVSSVFINQLIFKSLLSRLPSELKNIELSDDIHGPMKPVFLAIFEGTKYALKIENPIDRFSYVYTTLMKRIRTNKQQGTASWIAVPFPEIKYYMDKIKYFGSEKALVEELIRVRDFFLWYDE
ncbi:MAG: hypothetical protein Hyperionvirus1_165 [Hyperionvirus sp.]|uniref:Uncharacterized protein n=1 Tax=Hyperionvirus sp. TaxID=2487770 RepID=A0A3G5A5R6_9VIRU|nr:MAG: hypothetical protein Hyperionvirus1_165 [Hyperionvirus sp.]